MLQCSRNTDSWNKQKHPLKVVPKTKSNTGLWVRCEFGHITKLQDKYDFRFCRNKYEQVLCNWTVEVFYSSVLGSVFSFSRLDTDRAHQDKETLLKKLMDAEADGAAAAKQISALRESVSKLCCASVSMNLVRISITCPSRNYVLVWWMHCFISVFSLCGCRGRRPLRFQFWLIRKICCCRNWKLLKPRITNWGACSENIMDPRYGPLTYHILNILD